jgi:hypothetical protein
MFPFPGNPPTSGAVNPILSHTFTNTSISSTTSAINTTGATMLIAGIMSVGCPSATSGISDSQGNTWSIFDPEAGTASSTISACFYFVRNPTTSASHTLTSSGASFAGIFFAALSTATINAVPVNWVSGTTYSIGNVVNDNISGVSYASIINSNTGNQPSSSPSDWAQIAQGAGSASASTQQGGAVVPVQNGTLVLTLACGNDTGSTYTVNSGFTIIDTATGGATWQGGGWAYLIQATPASVNPTWTMGGGNAPRLFAVYNAFIKN